MGAIKFKPALLALIFPPAILSITLSNTALAERLLGGRVIGQSRSNVFPIFDRRGRTIVVNGVRVPTNAAGWFMDQGRIQWVYSGQNHEQNNLSNSSPESVEGKLSNQREGRPTLGADENFRPIIGADGSRTIAINGMAIPQGVIGWRINGNQIEWQRDSSFPKDRNGRNSNPDPAELPPPQNPARPNPRAGAASNQLIPANTNKNPGFQYSIQGPGYSEMCQATLIAVKKKTCVAATAAHCLSGGIQRTRNQEFLHDKLDFSICDAKKGTESYRTGLATITMADFGTVEAQLYANTDYTKDSGVFSFPCEKGPGNISVLPISENPLVNAQEVYYGKVMGGLAGLYRGIVEREPGVVSINWRPIGERQERIRQSSQVAIQQGDSGGGIYRNGDNGMELAGVLSTGDLVSIGNYATNESLNFIRCFKEAIVGR